MRLCVFHQPDLAIGFTALQTRIQHELHEEGIGNRPEIFCNHKNATILPTPNVNLYPRRLNCYDIPDISPILWLTSITIRPSFLPHHERIRQHQRRRIFKNSSGPSARQQWKHDIGIVQRDARSHSLRPEPYKSPCYQPSNW